MKKAILIVGVLLVFSGFVSRAKAADTWWFPDDWEDEPGATIQDAVEDCNNGDTIYVRYGTYSGPGNRGIDFSKGLSAGQTKNIKLIGDMGPDYTIIDCSYADRGFYFHNNENSTSRVEGFTIANGYPGSGVPDIGNGGGIYCKSSSPLIRNCSVKYCTAIKGGGVYCESSATRIDNCIIVDNYADFGGGIYCDSTSSVRIMNYTIIENNFAGDGAGVYIDSAPVLIESCTIINNEADYSGGGISLVNCTDSNIPTIEYCNINGNSAGNTSSAGYGGGIYCESSHPSITNCDIIDNEANGPSYSYGGGMEIVKGATVGSLPVINNCVINGNKAVHGGGIDCYDSSSPTITKTEIKNNTATGGEGGGLLLAEYCNAEISNCTITGNLAGSAGGGIDCINSSSPQILNSIISCNASSIYSGGINCLNDCSPTVSNCTLSSNTADVNGGGIGLNMPDDFITNPTACNPIIKNCIFENNQGYAIYEYDTGSDANLSYSLFFDNKDGDYYDYDIGSLIGADQINGLAEAHYTIDGDPLFVQEPNDGGDGWGVGGNDDFGDLHLTFNSPCIESGDPAYVPEPGEVDIDNEQRISRGQIDIGADEFYCSTSIVADFDCSGAVDWFDLDDISKWWLQSNNWVDIAPDQGDGIVNLLDFTKFAEYWLESD